MEYKTITKPNGSRPDRYVEIREKYAFIARRPRAGRGRHAHRLRTGRAALSANTFGGDVMMLRLDDTKRGLELVGVHFPAILYLGRAKERNARS